MLDTNSLGIQLKKILLTGSDGQLGRCIQDISQKYSEFKLFAFNRESLDITQLDSVMAKVEKINPDVIVNTAAYTAVDKAEEQTSSASLVNFHGVKNLCVAANRLNIPIIHISTDYVFDGTKDKPYIPSDNVNPLGVYGRTKWQGEEEIRQSIRNHIIVRTSWVFSEHGNNFVKSILKVASVNPTLEVVDDQRGCPTYAGDLAIAIYSICKAILYCDKDHWGTYHYCGNEETTWFDFSREILEKAKSIDIIKTLPQINPIKLSPMIAFS